MPFESEAQRRFLFKFHPDIAKRWAHEYGTPKGLPYHVSKSRSRKSSRLAHTLASHTVRRKKKRNRNRIRKYV